jgi:hypothetical protein
VRPPKFKVAKGTQQEAAERYIERKTVAARTRAVKNIEALDVEVKKYPKYSNIEFKCISDFDKCRADRGKFNINCIVAYCICMGRRLIPFVR